MVLQLEKWIEKWNYKWNGVKKYQKKREEKEDEDEDAMDGFTVSEMEQKSHWTRVMYKWEEREGERANSRGLGERKEELEWSAGQDK